MKCSIIGYDDAKIQKIQCKFKAETKKRKSGREILICVGILAILQAELIFCDHHVIILTCFRVYC